MIAGPTDRGITRLAALVEEGRARARATGRGVLVSLAEPAPGTAPLALLTHARGATSGTLATAAREATLYWERPAERVALTGIGAAASLTAAGQDRFATLDRAWLTLRDGAVIDDPSNGAPGVGPTLMGGFAFEPDGPRDTAWRDFPAALLVLPRILVATIGDDCWITTTLRIDADGRPDLSTDEVTTLRAQALAAGARPLPPASDPGAQLTYSDARPAAEWRALVESTTAAIRSGAMEKVVLARTVHATTTRDLDATAAIRHLRDAFPSTHVFGIWRGGRAFVGATPERLVRLEGDAVRSSSLAGSIGRGAGASEDATRIAALLASAKDRAEHEMVRRDLCAGLAELCEDVTAASEPSILTLPHVHHLHTPVTARLRPGRTLLGLLERLHPTPAVGGTPRATALGFIRENEGMDRGWYAAPVGWLGRTQGEFAVALRSGVIAGREAWLFAGCGVVADSEAGSEYEESMLKLRPMQLALSTAGRRDAAADPVAPRLAAAGGHANR